MTTSGAVSGSTRNMSTPPEPRNRWRTRAMATSVPSTTATAVDTAATFRLVSRASVSCGYLNGSAQLSSVKPFHVEVELAERLVEREGDDHRDRDEQVDEHEPGHQAQADVAPAPPGAAGGRRRGAGAGAGVSGGAVRVVIAGSHQVVGAEHPRVPEHGDQDDRHQHEADRAAAAG